MPERLVVRNQIADRLGWPNNAERTYVYDQQGQLTEWHLKVGAFRNDAALSYNEHGDVVRWVTLQSGTPLPERVSPSDWSHELEHGYQYDEHGNWLEQKTRTLVKAGETSNKESVLRRVLTYY